MMTSSSQLIILFSLLLLLIPSTHQSIPEEESNRVQDTWKTSEGGIQMDSLFPIEDRESLLRDLRSLRARYFNRPRTSSFPYYKGLGRK